MDENYSVSFTSTHAVIERNKNKYIISQIECNLTKLWEYYSPSNSSYLIDPSSVFTDLSSQSTNTPTQPSTNNITNILRRFHHSYGHRSYTSLYKLIMSDCIKDLGINKNNITYDLIIVLTKEKCEGCLKGKFTKRAMTGAINYHTDGIMQIWFCDLIGPIFGHYILNAIDGYSGEYLTLIIKTKDESNDAIKDTVNQLQVSTGLKLRHFHSDGGGEFINKKLQSFFLSNGTKQTSTPPYTPQLNKAERYGRTLLEMTRSILYHCNSPLHFWMEAVLYSKFILNRCVTTSHPHTTPFEMRMKYKPSIKNMHVFGSDTFYYNQPINRDNKLSPTSRPGIFVGFYDDNDYYYKVYDIQDKKLVKTTHIEC